MTALTLPVPWYGGKRRAAPLIWAALGDPGHYVEPFAGSAAVLLARPAEHVGALETLNDLDGMIANALRAIRSSPAEVAEYCSAPLVEVDVHARLAWLHDRSRDPDWVAWLEGDPDHSDARAAGWWLYVTAASIDYPLGSTGSWRQADGHLRFLPGARGCKRLIPSVGSAGRGIFSQRLSEAGALDQLMTRLAARLRHVRITCGDWRRVLAPALLRPGVRRGGEAVTAVLLDPPLRRERRHLRAGRRHSLDGGTGVVSHRWPGAAHRDMWLRHRARRAPRPRLDRNRGPGRARGWA